MFAIKRLVPIFKLLILTTLPLQAAETEALPGPENRGLRLRLAVAPRAEAGREGFDVRVDLLNTSCRAITLRAAWPDDDVGDLKDYIEATTSIECFPAVRRWSGGVLRRERTSPQPEHVLEAGAILSVRWQTEGRRLKNRVTNPNEVQNPEFPYPGLYSVHATLNVITKEGAVLLRSNEQLVPVGGSHAMPKSTLGHLLQVETDWSTAIVDLGARQKVEPGDQFEHLSKGDSWQLTIVKVEPNHSLGKLEMRSPGRLDPPIRGAEVTLMRKK